MKLTDNILRFTLFTVALILFGFGIHLSLSDKVTNATATYGAGVICLIFVYLSSFQSFEGLGIKAKLLDQKIEESEAVIKKLQKTLILMASTLFSLSSRSGRLDAGMSRIERYRLVEEIEKEFLGNGISKEDIDAAKNDWHRFVTIDLLSPIYKSLQNIISKKQSELMVELQSKFGLPEIEEVKLRSHDSWEFERNLKELFKIKDYKSIPEKLKEIVDSCIALSEKEKEDIYKNLKEEISDIEYYAKKHEFRRLDVWLNE